MHCDNIQLPLWKSQQLYLQTSLALVPKVTPSKKNLDPQYCIKFNCTNFDKLILRKIIKIAATRCHILQLKCTKFDFGWGSAQDRAGGAYGAPPYPLAGFKGPTSKGREGKEKGGGGKGRRERE